ncbi:two-component system response regulator, partial [human gut metagenome]
DDYISKPFSLREVAARVKAVLRRTRQGETEHAPEQIVYKTLVLDIIKKKVCIDGEEAPLTKKNLKSYCCFCRIKDAYSRARIY